LEAADSALVQTADKFLANIVVESYIVTRCAERAGFDRMTNGAA